MNDARHFQIAVLSALLAYGSAAGLLQMQWWHFPVVMATCLATQWGCSRVFGVPFDARSAIITALSLSILLRVNVPLAAVFGAGVAISSKFFIRDETGHIFNPANLALILCSLLGFGWISPGQWGSELWSAFLFCCLAVLVLMRSGTALVSLTFITTYAALVIGRALWLGDPLAIPLHGLQSGAVLLFTFFMISDPKTTPPTAEGKIAFAALTAFIAALLQFAFFVPLAIIYALGIVSVLYSISKTMMFSRLQPMR
jgi:Na+-transporting NADH:ubiquinone oxidoreductase subunit NqrB